MGTLYVTAPSYGLSGPVERDKILAVAARAAAVAGLTVVASPLLDRHLVGWGAWLPAAERTADLLAALDHDGVWACKGGYGCIHAVPALLAATPTKKPWLAGYSDVTVLHTVWRQRGWGEGLYGHLGKMAGGREETSALALLRGEGYVRDQRVDALARVLQPGRADGESFVACLSVLAGLVGTGAVPSLDGRILFCEDIDEKPFQIDHAFEQLHQSGHLRGVRALVGGSFPHTEKPDYHGPTPDELLAAWGVRLGIPVLARMPFGHLDDQLVIPSGRQVSLALEAERWRLTVHPR